MRNNNNNRMIVNGNSTGEQAAMKLYYGATYKLEDLINTHLFIISPNNSGSTFLKNVLATSTRTWNLYKEGQHTYGFAGPNAKETRAGLLWASDQDWLNEFVDDTAYNWHQTRKAWYFQAFSLNPTAAVFIEKSPPFLLQVKHIATQFKNAKFVFMVRNPYATIEGIRRGFNKRTHTLPRGTDILTAAIKHTITCFTHQQNNIRRYGNRGIFFSYETMCDQPNRVAQMLQTLVPELDDLNLCQRVVVKRNYNEVLHNMNDQQISRLSQDDLSRINHVLEQHQNLLDYFGYSLHSLERSI